MATIHYSIVVPVYNEEACLEPLLEELLAVMENLAKPYEILLIDDGSTDRSWQIIQAAAANHRPVAGYRLNRNFGHQAAIYAGLESARGQAIAILDGDGQDPPELLPTLFGLWEEGYDVAYSVRRKRKEGFVKRLCYRTFYRLLSLVAQVPVPLDSGDFSVIDHGVAEFITSINDRTPFIRGLRSWYGGKQIAVEYDRRGRSAGKSKYSWFKLMDLAITGITSFSKIPLRLAIYLGGFMSCFAFAYAVFVGFRRLLFRFPPPEQGWGWSAAVTMVALVGGLNLLLLGFVGEYIAHMFDSAKAFPVFLLRESTNGSEAGDQAAEKADTHEEG